MQKRNKIILIILIIIAVLLVLFFALFWNGSSRQPAEIVFDTGRGQPTYNIPDTGQTHCYDNEDEIECPDPGDPFFGQDAQYRHEMPDYTNNGDGTITDNVTGLMWQQGMQELEWSEAADDARADRTGDYDDWRVPTIKELYSLINFNGNTGKAAPDSKSTPGDAIPFIDTGYFDFEYGSTRYIDAQYLTRTSYIADDDMFFGVNLADGRIKGYPKNRPQQGGKYFARYVREDETIKYGQNDFVDNEDHTITDRETELMWMQVDSGDELLEDDVADYTYQDGSLNWEEGLHFCETLEFAGYDDWRLPDAKELQSIVDYSRAPDETDSAAIDEIFEVTMIQNEEDEDDYPYFWTNTTHLEGQGAKAAYFAFGRAQGFMQDLVDIHGAGAQRSDDKIGDPADFPEGRGPQGDVIRIYNHARCVRGEGELIANNQIKPQNYYPEKEVVDQPDQPESKQWDDPTNDNKNESKQWDDDLPDPPPAGNDNNNGNNNEQPDPDPEPTPEAYESCIGLNQGDVCSYGTFMGICRLINSVLACLK